jgi:RNA polymerase sigma factor (sigma-70 family)
MTYKVSKTKISREDELNLFKKYRILQNTLLKNLDDEKKKKTELLMGKVREKIIEQNLGLVFTMCHKHKNKIGSQLEFDDLVQFGMIGLLNAVDRYDYDSGVKFSSYASTTIELTMFRNISDTSRIIRIPERVVHKFLKVRKNSDSDDLEKYGNDLYFNVCVLGILFNERTSIDTISDVVSSEYTPLDDLSDYFLDRDLTNILNKLNKRERLVVQHFYGVCGKAKLSCDQISNLIFASKPTVYKVLEDAIRKLKTKKKYLEGWGCE